MENKMDSSKHDQDKTMETETPAWFSRLLDDGFIPYVATSAHLLTSLNLKPFGVQLQAFAMQNPNDKPFLDAYLSANFLSFGSKDEDYKMPSWVYVDCVLLPESVVGFMLPKSKVPADLLEGFRQDSPESYEGMTHIPLSGQIDSHAIDGSFVNFSLFSLGRRVNGFKQLALYTKALSTEVHGMRNSGKEYRIIGQYDNPSLKVHGGMTTNLEIDQAIVPLHPGKDMTFVLKMKVDYDPLTLDTPRQPVVPTFWLNAKDITAKRQMQDEMKDGNTFSIVPPYAERRNEGIYLPILKSGPKL
ncbi:MAG TPA: hypothetical protein DCY07_02410 [Rhodospirillaceae bacterium]|nr:hypothetical protein [Rhodospirillaceae bacterium]